MAPSRSATSSRPAPRGNKRRFRDCEQTIESDISRWKRVIGDGLGSQTDGRQATEVAIAADVLNRMLELGRPEGACPHRMTRNTGRGTRVHTADLCSKV